MPQPTVDLLGAPVAHTKVATYAESAAVKRVGRRAWIRRRRAAASACRDRRAALDRLPFRRSSRPIVLRARPSTRAMVAGRMPCSHSSPSVYLSSAVIWRYGMVGFLLLEENRSLAYPRSPFSFLKVLHLECEFAVNNKEKTVTRARRAAWMPSMRFSH